MILTCPECSTRYFAKDEAIGPNGRTVRCSKCQNSWFVSLDLDEYVLKDNESEDLKPLTAQSTSPDVTNDIPPWETSAPPKNKAENKTGFENLLSQNQENVQTYHPEIEDLSAQTPLKETTQPAFTTGAHVSIRDRADKQRRTRRLSIVGLIWSATIGTLIGCAGLAYIFRQDIVTQHPKMATLYKAVGIEVTRDGLSFDPPITRSIYMDGEPVLVINGSVKNISGRRINLHPIIFSLHNKNEEKLVEWRFEFEKSQLEKNKRAEYVTHFPNPPLDAVNLTYRFTNDTIADQITNVPTQIGFTSDGDKKAVNE